MPNTSMTFRMPEMMALKIESLAEATGRKKSELVVDALVPAFGPSVEEFVKFHMGDGKTRKEAEEEWAGIPTASNKGRPLEDDGVKREAV